VIKDPRYLLGDAHQRRDDRQTPVDEDNLARDMPSHDDDLGVWTRGLNVYARELAAVLDARLRRHTHLADRSGVGVAAESDGMSMF
jgi:hypothetical protein